LEAPYLFYAAGDDLADLRWHLTDRIPGGTGDWRIAVTAESDAQLNRRMADAIWRIDTGRTIAGDGLHFRDRPVDGDIAFLFPPFGAVYKGVGRELSLAFPEAIGDSSRNLGDDADQRLHFASRLLKLAPRDTASAGALQSAATILNTQILQKILGLTPAAAIGMSIGECNMLVAMGAWRDPYQALADFQESGFLDSVGGDRHAVASYWGLPEGVPVAWESHEIIAPVDEVEAVVATTPQVWLTMIFSPERCIISGFPPSSADVIAQLQLQKTKRIPGGLALHGPFAADLREMLYPIYRRRLNPVDGVKFYFNAVHDTVDPDADIVADCLTDEILDQSDLRPTILQAWRDGIRTFVDIGPKSDMAWAVFATLGDRPHLAVSLDGRGRGKLQQLADAVAALFVAGAAIDIGALSGRLAQLRDNSFTDEARNNNCLMAQRADTLRWWSG
jgi:acyl transferase domain-containing protein